MADEKLPLLQVRPSAVALHVLVVGDPARAEDAASFLDNVRQVGANREYVTFTGEYGGRPVSVASHGIGSAGAGLCFEELARAGARVLIRAGTCGAVADDIEDGTQVIATGAVRDEGLTPRLIPMGYPAIADHRIVAALERTATAAGAEPRTGVVLTSDLFYPSEALGQDWSVWKKSRVMAVEMEAATLFILAGLHGLCAGGIFTVDGNPTLAAQDMSEYAPHRPVVAEGKKAMLGIALDALVSIEAS